MLAQNSAAAAECSSDPAESERLRDVALTIARKVVLVNVDSTVKGTGFMYPEYTRLDAVLDAVKRCTWINATVGQITITIADGITFVPDSAAVAESEEARKRA